MAQGKQAFAELQEYINDHTEEETANEIIPLINALRLQDAEDAFEAGELTEFYMKNAAMPKKKDFTEYKYKIKYEKPKTTHRKKQTKINSNEDKV